ncbi:MAG TPA: arginase family protein [Bdellovibrionota bacterium]|nr:arginase family protein [Bdellovibrionota bacterium]
MQPISRAKTPIQTLRAPGRGILTVSTAVADPAAIFSKYFGKKTYDIGAKWTPEFRDPTQPIVLGYPCDTGSGIVRGSAYGPIAIREALYKKNPKLAANDFGDVPVIPNLLHDSMLNKAQLDRSGAYLYESGIPHRAVSPLSLLEEILVQILESHPGAKTLTLGGDHSMSGAVMRAYRRAGRHHGLAMLQLDAHTDLMEERFGVEHCFATWSAHAVREFQNPAAFVQVGLRASRYGKEHWESEFGLKQYWSKEVRSKSAVNFADALLKHWASLNCERLYISNDIDGTDALEAPSTGTPETGGLRSEWVCKLLARLSARIEIVGSDLVEVAPVLGAPAQQKKTVACARDQILALFGR